MKMRPGAYLGGRYRLVNRIATGGVGEVWKALDEPADRWVAVKVLRDRHLGDAGFRERFRAEARHTATLNHPGLAEVFDYVDDGTLAYLVMEYLAGRPLSALLRGGRELGARLTLGIVGQVAVTLQAAHDAGVIHRDIKPDNLIIGYDGQVKVTDFGIARGADMATLTQPGVVVGTAVYMSPEQAEAQRVTAATDVYSLGVVCYECLAGSAPFLGSTPVEIAYSHVREQPPALPPYVPRALRDLVIRCLAKDPADRPESMAEVAETTYSIAQTLNPPRATAVPLVAAPADPRPAARRGRHRAASRWRHRARVPAHTGPARGFDGRPSIRRSLPAAGAAVKAAASPVSAWQPVRRRRAVMASIAGTTVLASGLVLGAQIGFLPAMEPYSDAEATASPAPAAPSGSSGQVVPQPSVSSLNSEAPAGRGGRRAVGSPSPTGSATPTTPPRPTWPAMLAPSRQVSQTPTPVPGEPPAPTPTDTPTSEPSPPETEEGRDPDGPPADGRQPRETAPRDASAKGSRSPVKVPTTGLLTPPGTPSGTAPPSDDDAGGDRSPAEDGTGEATPDGDIGLRVGPLDVPLDVEVELPDAGQTSPR